MLPSPADLALLSDADLEARYARALAELGIATEEDAHRVLDVETAQLIERYSRIEAEYPLAAAVLWRRDEAAWDQRRLACALTAHLTLVLGGNRSGKTYAILECLVAFALGRDHPAVRAWLADNDLPPDLIPEGPGECFAVANSAAQSMKLHRRDIRALLPRSAQWHNFNANDEAWVEIPVPGHPDPAVIWFKSCKQGHDGFKGTDPRFVAISEEPNEPAEGRLILAECLRGTSTHGGRVVLEMTPQNGFTWVWDDLVVAQKHGCQLVKLNTDYNTLVPDYDSVQRWLASLSPEEQRMRREGEFVAREGLVYPGWTRGLDLRDPGCSCDPFDIPADWPRFCGADFGLVDPTVVLWGALGPDNLLVIYREHYQAGPTWEEHARIVRDLQGREIIEAAWGDPSGSEAMDLWAGMDLYFDLANRDRRAGIDAVADRLRLQADGRPRLKVFNGKCPNLLREFEEYRRDPNKRDGDPIKRNDHALDALRYLVMGIVEWRGL